ncbi:MAG: M18 family aminopeptidase [Methylococcales bacterium]|nr:M18 family aminopeptidase [Methylococcales bacterium]
MNITDLLAFIDASPSPWHVVATVTERLKPLGFKVLTETSPWTLKPGGKYLLCRDGSVAAIIVGTEPFQQSGAKLIGAHTDSPGFRIKPKPLSLQDGYLRLAVEVYGGPTLATFADRDLSLAGRVSYQQGSTIKNRMVRIDQPLLRLANLPIHLNRGVNSEGLKFDLQNELPLLFANSGEGVLENNRFIGWLAEQAGLDDESIKAFELAVYDTQKGAVWGMNNEFYSNSQIDNLACCHAALMALTETCDEAFQQTRVSILFDHEEIGSQTAEGADGRFFTDVMHAIAGDHIPENVRQGMARSFLISADMAHAYQPNFPSYYELDHKVIVNQGPVIKSHAKRRYATDSLASAWFSHWCEQAGVPVQQYSHRGDIPCGSTIGPISAAKLGIRTVDVGSPMWAMHSARESAGVLDHDYLTKAFTAFYRDNDFLTALSAGNGS